MALALFDRCALLASIDSALPQSLTVRSTISPHLLKMIFISGSCRVQSSVALVETWHQSTQGNAALTLLRCRRRRARPDLGDSAKDVERQRHNYGLMALARVQWSDLCRQAESLD
jgi:hypothetical protein